MSQHYLPDHKSVLDVLLLSLPGVSTGQMFGHPSYKIMGKMFAALMMEGVILKLPQDTIDKLMQRDNVSSFAPGGEPMRLWVLIGVSDPAEYVEYRPYMEEALAFVAALAGHQQK